MIKQLVHPGSLYLFFDLASAFDTFSILLEELFRAWIQRKLNLRQKQLGLSSYERARALLTQTTNRSSTTNAEDVFAQIAIVDSFTSAHDLQLCHSFLM